MPGKVQTSLGGVARNMGEAAHRTLTSLQSSSPSPSSSLKNDNTSTMVVAPLGDDPFGLLVRSQMEGMGMRSDGLLIGMRDGAIGERRSPVCNMVLSGDGNLVGGVADFSALDTLRSEEVSAFCMCLVKTFD